MDAQATAATSTTGTIKLPGGAYLLSRLSCFSDCERRSLADLEPWTVEQHSPGTDLTVLGIVIALFQWLFPKPLMLLLIGLTP